MLSPSIRCSFAILSPFLIGDIIGVSYTNLILYLSIFFFFIVITKSSFKTKGTNGSFPSQTYAD